MGRRRTSPLAWTLELVIVVALLAAFITWMASDRGGFERAKKAPDCGKVVTSTCLESRSGEFHPVGLGRSVSGPYRRQVFEDAEGDNQAFDMRMSRHDARRFRKADVRGLYYDGNLVGVETESGKRYWGNPGWRRLPTRTSMAVIAGLLGVVGACAVSLALARRR